MADTGAPKSAPQFQTAEYSPSPIGDVCRSCNQPIGSQYYRVNGAMTCATCALAAAQNVPKDSTGAYSKALLFGMGAAFLGLVIYATFEIVTGWIIGYVSLAVGWIIGAAMMKASGGIGGRKYQITAALLTYAAVSMAAIPVLFAQQSKQPSAEVQQARSPSTAEDSSQQSARPDEGGKAPMGLGMAVITLAGIGLASPFIELTDGVSGVIGLVILFVGIQLAWRMTAGTIRLGVEGPYQNA